MRETENIRAVIRRVARETPNSEAVVFDGLRWSYAELDQRIDALARALLATGVRKGDRVATLSTPHPDFLVALLATAQLGAIWIGLNPRYRLPELKFVLGDAEPVVLLARTQVEGRDYRDVFVALAESCRSLRSSVVLNGDLLFEGAEAYETFIGRGTTIVDTELATAEQNAGGRDPLMIVYTSGSTGTPKGAILHHQGAWELSLAQNRLWPVSPLRVLNYFPINHIGCVIDLSLPTLLAGGAIVFLEQFEPAKAMSLMVDERCTLWGSVPSVLQMQLALPNIDAYDLSAIQLIVWEGAAISEEVLDRLLSFGAPLATNYGMTETTSAMIAMSPTLDRERLLHTVGYPIEGVAIRIVKDDGSDAGTDEPGEVWARSAYNMLGYWRRPEATAAAIVQDGWLRTGDVAVRHADDSYSIVGRIKEMYKSGGYNIYPREIENVLESHPAVALAAVVSVADPLWGEVGVAYVVAKADVTVGELEAHCRDHLANYKIPKHFHLHTELPLLAIGKIDKIALKGLAAAALEGNKVVVSQ